MLDPKYFTCIEDEYSDVLLKGYDSSTLKRDLKYRIEELPAHGDLYDASDLHNRLKVGSILSATDSCKSDRNATGACYPGVNVKYKGKKDFFNFPTTMLDKGSATPFVDESFRYSAVAMKAGYSSYARSIPRRQQVKVVNKNDATTISGPLDALVVYGMDAEEEAARERFCKASENAAREECVISGIATVSSLNFTGVDRNIEIVRVSVASFTGNGYFSLNMDHLGLANFVSCNSPTAERSWTCLGDGDMGNEMVFVAQPGDLNRLFHGFRYENRVKNTTDSVTIKVYDGNDASLGCIPASEQNVGGSIHENGCIVSTFIINVEVKELMVKEMLGDGRSAQPLLQRLNLPFEACLGLAGVALLLSCLCCKMLLRKCCHHLLCRNRMKKKSSLEEEKKATLDLKGGGGQETSKRPDKEKNELILDLEGNKIRWHFEHEDESGIEENWYFNKNNLRWNRKESNEEIGEK